MHWLLVFIGGGLGSLARHAVNRTAFHLLGPSFPWGTMAVNIAGSFLIGLAAGLFASFETSQPARLFLITGFLGGFTTFSAFSLDALTLWQRGEPWVAGGYVAASVMLSFAAIVAGLLLSRLA
jgi:CrcB protein